MPLVVELASSRLTVQTEQAGGERGCRRPRLATNRIRTARRLARGPPLAVRRRLLPRTEFKGRTVLHQSYDGVTNDLASAGLGRAGLQSATPPPVANPLDPTAEELRRLAIYINTRALVDTSGGGYGEFYGPGVPLEPGGEVAPELIAGDEFLVFSDRGRDRERHHDGPGAATASIRQRPCIVTGAFLGLARRLRRDRHLGRVGPETRLRRRLHRQGHRHRRARPRRRTRVNLIRGEREEADAAGDASNFTAPIGPAAQAAFNAETPDRFAFKHAHSEDNPERPGAAHVLDSIGSPSSC